MNKRREIEREEIFLLRSYFLHHGHWCPTPYRHRGLGRVGHQPLQAEECRQDYVVAMTVGMVAGSQGPTLPPQEFESVTTPVRSYTSRGHPTGSHVAANLLA